MAWQLEKEYIKLEEEAKQDHIPIMQRDGILFLLSQCYQYDCHSCLEIGSAIGYSALMMAGNLPNFYVETLERDESRYNRAVDNIKKYEETKNITIHLADALLFSGEKLTRDSYDCLFIDGAKAQYQKFFEKYMPYISKNGICIVDNLDFHGMVADIPNIKNRGTRQLVTKIKRFRQWIETQEQYTVDYYPVGDGVCIIRRR